MAEQITLQASDDLDGISELVINGLKEMLSGAHDAQEEIYITKATIVAGLKLLIEASNADDAAKWVRNLADYSELMSAKQSSQLN